MNKQCSDSIRCWLLLLLYCGPIMNKLLIFFLSYVRRCCFSHQKSIKSLFNHHLNPDQLFDWCVNQHIAFFPRVHHKIRQLHHTDSFFHSFNVLQVMDGLPATRWTLDKLESHWSGVPGIFTLILSKIFLFFLIAENLQWKWVDGLRNRSKCWCDWCDGLRTEEYSEKAPTWRRNPKRPQGLDGKRRTVNSMNWPKCCLYHRPSPPSWTKPP